MTPTYCITVQVMVLSEYTDPGHWCDSCALPSALQIPYRVVMPTTLTVVGSGDLVACTDCGDIHRARPD